MTAHAARQNAVAPSCAPEGPLGRRPTSYTLLNPLSGVSDAPEHPSVSKEGTTMAKSSHQTAGHEAVDTSLCLSVAINALDAVRDILGEAAEADHGVLRNVSADNFACLLGIIVKEMRAAHEGA